jgi:hypothetical protein
LPRAVSTDSCLAAAGPTDGRDIAPTLIADAQAPKSCSRAVGQDGTRPARQN